LAPNETYIDGLVYEVHPQSDLTGEDETFHFVLATGRYKDNRIPPKGFDISTAADRICEPVWHGQSEPNYFTNAEYTGGYDEINLQIPFLADNISVTLYYQGTSREYIEFLRDEINGTASTLASPTPSGEANAYIIQDDPFFSQLKEWGNTIWDLWYHNHGLDGSGVSVEGIVPCEMAEATLETGVVFLPGDFEPDGDVDFNDLAVLVAEWLQSGEDLLADIHPASGDGFVNFLDFAKFAQGWK